MIDWDSWIGTLIALAIALVANAVLAIIVTRVMASERTRAPRASTAS